MKQRTLPGARLGAWLLAAALIAALTPYSALTLLALNLGIALAFLFDRAGLLRSPVTVKRVLPTRLRAGQTHAYQLHVESSAASVQVAELPVAGFSFTPGQHQVTSPILEATLHAHTHGRAQLTHVAVRKQSRLGLCAVQTQLPCPDLLRAYPNLPLGRAGLATLERHELGFHPQRLSALAPGSELASLREYSAGDALRSIDWKATARRHRPITRSYQPERSQTVWIVLDASRTMTLPLEDRPATSRFSAALEAALELADTALQSGDRVGVLVHGERTLLSIAPRRGRAHFVHMVEQLLTVQPETGPLAAEALVRTLTTLAPKRSMLALFSDLDGEGDLRALAAHLPLLTRRHLTVCFSQETRGLHSQAQRPVERTEDVYQKLAAHTLLQRRAQLGQLLGERGMPVVETRALSRAALRRYREVKLAGRL